MQHSRNLIDEQFNHKVSLALCKAVSDLSETSSCTSSASCIAPGASEDLECGKQLTDLMNTGGFDDALDQALSFYGIELPYSTSIVNEQEVCAEDQEQYSCSLCPLGTQTHLLKVEFQGKAAYILGQMGLMLGASIFILLFIFTVFVLANYHLLKQQRISTLNVDFFNSMAHEFRTPLTNIKLAMQLLSKTALNQQPNKYIDIVNRESLQLMKQVECVLSLAKLEGGEYQLEFEDISLEQLLRQVIQDMDLQIREKKAAITLDVQEAIPFIRGDRFHLSSAFKNIIDNALKYTLEQPQIYIRVEESSTGIQLLFQDNGIGISKVNQAIIFNKFQRISNNQIHHHKGFGLGLSYVKKIIELHQGSILLSSELDQGSRFNLHLPIAA